MSAPEKATIKSPVPHLWQIAATGDVNQLADILKRGADINASNPSGLTPLMVAAYHGRIEMVRALIEHGAQVNATDDEGVTAAMLADDAGHDEIVRILVGRAVKRKRPAPAAEASQLQSTAPETRLETEPEDHAPPSPAVRTLQEPPDIWDMVHETRTEFSLGSAFFGRLSLRHSLIAAAILVITAGVSALSFMTLRRSSSGDPIPVQSRSPNKNQDVRAAQSNTNQAVRNQRPLSKAARTAPANASVFNPRTIMAGVHGLREPNLVAPRAEIPTSVVRPTVALFHADDKKKTQKSSPHIRNSSTLAGVENRDGSQLIGARSDNDKRANSTPARKETGKLPTSEPISPPKPNPIPKGKVIQWP